MADSKIEPVCNARRCQSSAALEVVIELIAFTAIGALPESGKLEREPPSRWSKFVFGDWGRVIRDPSDVFRLAFFIGTIVWVAIGGAAADGLVGASLVLLGGRLLDLPRPYDLALILGMTVTGWGSALQLYGGYEWYDDVVHFLMPMLVTPIVYILLARLQVLPQLRDLTQVHHQLGFFLIAFCIGMTIAGGWEVVEWWLDEWTGETRVKDAADTASDLTSGVYGSAVAGLVLVGWSLAGLPLRREPAAVVEQWLADHRLVRRSNRGRNAAASTD